MQKKKPVIPNEQRAVTAKPLDEREWVVMFVDIEGSTRLKYQELAQDKWHFRDIVMGLMDVVQDAAQARATKFTGDGAMIVFPILNDRRGCVEAIEAAEKIIQGVDRTNFEFHGPPPIHIRIGIATGLCAKVGGTVLELSGRPADLAARLCSEADRDGVLVDNATKEAFEANTSTIEPKRPGTRFQPCNRRLMLKGVPLTPDPGPFWHCNVHRLVQSTETNYASEGLVAVYLDRPALEKDFPDGAITCVDLAAPDSSILVAGRTLKSWAEKKDRLSLFNRGLKFYFLLSSRESWNLLDEEEKKIVNSDFERTYPKFLELVETDGGQFHSCLTEHLILDGVTFARIIFPGGSAQSDGGRLIALQDLNVFRPDGGPRKEKKDQEVKVTLFWVCTCGQQNSKGGASCTAHGLLRRTLQFWTRQPKPELFP